MHTALIGGLGTLKTTTAKKLCELVEDTEYVDMPRFAVRIPMALQHTSHPDLLRYSKREYINVVLSNAEASELTFARADVDAFGRDVFKRYGSKIASELALASVPENKIGVFDGVATVENVRYMKEKGVYIVGLECAFETQIERVIGCAGTIDPKERKAVVKQIRDAQVFFETEKYMPLADIVHNTDRLNHIEVACAIAPVILSVRK